MNKRFICFIYFFATLILSLFPFNYVQAAEGSINATAGSSSVVVGGTVKVTVRVSSGSEIGSWRFDLNYDSTKLRLSPTSSPASVAGFYTSSGQRSASYSYTFTALAAGNTAISVRNGAIVGMDETYMTVTSSGTSINISEQSLQPGAGVNYSGNNYLSSLVVEGLMLTPVFDRGTLEYSLELEPGTQVIRILAVPEDSKASVTGDGGAILLDGVNRFEVKVRAENGNERIYVVNALLEEKDPIEVMVGKKKYTVIRRSGFLEAPANYLETTAMVKDMEVPAFKGQITGLTLVGLKSLDGETGLYVYDSKKKTFRLYRELRFNGAVFYPFSHGDDVKVPEGYGKFVLNIDNQVIDAYRMYRNSRYALMYGMNVDTGESGFYLYDSKEGTLQRYNEEENLYYNDILGKYLTGLVVLGSVFTATFLITGILAIRNRRRQS